MTGYIEVFGHGGDVETAASRFGREAANFLDFSANINPLGPPRGVLEAIQQGLQSVIRYPDPGHRGFKALLSERLGVRQEQISVGNGAAESMALILLGLAPRKVGTVEPGFSEYRALARQFGAEVVHTEGREEPGVASGTGGHRAAHGKGRPALPWPTQQSKRCTIPA